MSMKKNMALLAAMAIMFDPRSFGQGQPENKIDFSPANKPVPKGCKEYWFNKNGGFSTEKMRHDKIVFKCHALNDNSAKKKFKKWEDNLSK